MPFRDYFDRLACVLVLAFVGMIVAWNIAPLVKRWHHGLMAQQLVEQIEQAEDGQVKVPIRQLAQLEHSAIDTLVQLAASPRSAVAAEARQVLEEKFAQWRISISANEAETSDFSARRFARALAEHVEDFGPAGKGWVESQALQIIEFSEGLNPQLAAELLGSCDTILKSIPARGPRLRTLAMGNSQQFLETPLPALPQVPLEVLAVPSELAIEVGKKQPQQTVEALESNKTTQTPFSPRSDWKPEWENSHPTTPQQIVQLPRTTENETPLAATEKKLAPVIDVPNPTEMAATLKSLESISSDVLFEKLPQVDFFQAGAIRSILRERGYDDTELELIQRMSAAEVKDRLQVIDDLTILPASQARRWLKRLIRDKNAQVRLKALAAIATTEDPQLYDLARELALSDQNSKVVELATRIMKQSR